MKTILNDPYVRVIGSRAEDVIRAALDAKNKATSGPDRKGEFSSQCPAHPDEVSSLRWRVSVDGRALLFCQAGCEFGAILKALDVEPYLVVPVRVEYDYYGREGDYRFTVVRTFDAHGKKKFKQGQRDGDGNWVDNVDGVETQILFRADQIAAAPRGPAETLWLCHTEEAEVLTARGWIRWPMVHDEDRFATVDRSTGRVRFAQARRVQRLEYRGPTVEFSSGARVTPDHRMWTRPEGGGKDRTERAGDVAPRRTIPSATASDHGGDRTVRAADARLYAAWQADGVWEARGAKVHFNIAKPRKIARLRGLLDELGIDYEIREYHSPSLVASGRAAQTWVVIPKGAHPAIRAAKSIPTAAVGWSLEAREALIEEVTRWDGDRSSETSGRYFTRDRASIDALQAVAAVTGVRADLAVQDRTGARPNSSIEYRLNLNWRAWRKAAPTDGGWYEGVVYCATVPDDTLITRRAGRVTVSHNCEGEKDACVVEASLDEGKRAGEYASTFPGGAHRDEQEALVAAVGDLGVRTLVVVVDRDKSEAGTKRGRRIARAMAQELPDLAVRIVIPIEGTGKDVAEIVDRFGDDWESRLETFAFDPEEDALTDYGAGLASGQMVLFRPEVGRPVLAMVGGDAPIPVLTGAVEPLAVHTSAAAGRRYQLEITPSIHVADPMTVTISAEDLSSAGAFLRWLSRVPEFGRIPLTKVPVGDIADGLRMFLDYRVRIAGKPVLISPEAVGWVDAATGVVADRADTGAELVFVDRDGRVVAATSREAGSVYAQPETRHAGVYGTDGDETEAAWAFWQALTFADPDVTAPVAGFIGATLLSPFMAAAGAGLRPGLTLIAPSGSGKTHGAASLLLGLAGCGGHQSGSAAGMRRKLEAGVGTMLWFDDTAAVEDTRMKEWMRVAITRSEFTLSDTDAGVNAVHGGGLTSVPVVSSEGVGWMAETAMRDRFIAVHPTNPQGRRSMWPGREGTAQWSDVQAVEVGLLGGQPNRAAGRVVAGVVEAARARGGGNVFEGVRGALLAATEGGVRREWAKACAQVGLDLVIDWLEGARKKAGESWPGREAGDWGTSLDWLREGWRVWAELGVDDTADAACSLVDEVVPRILQAHYDHARTHRGYSDFAIVGLPVADREGAGNALRTALGLGGDRSGVERGLPPVLVDTENHVWVRTSACASAYQRLVRTAEQRTTGANALASQVGAPTVGADPAWATFIKGGRVNSGLRVRVEGAGEAVYRRLSATASKRARDAAQW